MFTASPKVGKQSKPGQANHFSQWFSRTITKLMKKENFVRNLRLLTTDTATALDAMVKRTGTAAKDAEKQKQKTTGTFDPFDDIYHIVYQLTMRTVGATEIAESPELLARTLGLFEEVERNTSTARIIFPWMPTLGYVRQTIAGGKLYVIFDKIAGERRRTGRVHEDAFQFLMETGEDTVRILQVSFAWFFLECCLRLGGKCPGSHCICGSGRSSLHPTLACLTSDETLHANQFISLFPLPTTQHATQESGQTPRQPHHIPLSCKEGKKAH